MLVIALISTVLCLAISSSLRKDLLDREWSSTADFIATEAHAMLSEHDFAAPDTTEARQRFRRFYRQALFMPEIVRVKIYDRGMRVIWSDEPRLIGRRFADNPQLVGALAGKIMVNLEAEPAKGENMYERDSRFLVEVYVPLTSPGQEHAFGVVETYKEPHRVLVNIRRAQVAVLTMAAGGGALLYLSLFWIVRRAARRIDQQHSALVQRSSELTEANDELRSVQRQLVESERMAAVGEAVAAVAHGIRNPLANIRASAQVALLDCDRCAASALGPRQLKQVIAEVDRLESRLKALLGFLRPTEREREPVDVNAVVRSACALMAARVAGARVVVDEQFGDGLPTTRGAPLLLEQVFLSLIGNAVEAMPSGGRLTLTSGVERDGGASGRVFVDVRDTGCGIPPDAMPNIFRLFYTTKAQGTGLGLAIARKFTEAHGGVLTVESQPGKGTVFRVALPVAAA